MKRVALLFAAWTIAFAKADEFQQFESDFTAFVDRYCIQCHGPDKQKGDRRFDTIDFPIEDSATLIELQDILDLLNLGEMPPEEEEQPEASETLSIVAQLTEVIEERHALLASTDRSTALRRLNRREYLNTIRDLLYVNTSLFDPTQSFPRDEAYHHIDTLGDNLVTSSYLLERYIDAADSIIEKVFQLDSRPEPQTWHFTDNFRELSGLGSTMEKLCNYEYIALYEVPTSQRHEGAYGTIYDFISGVPHDGRYRIRVLAEAKNRMHNHIARVATTNPNQALELAIVPGNERVGEIGIPQRVEPILASFTLPDDQLEWHEATVWLDEGYTPRFTFPNGTNNLRSAFRPLFDAIAPSLDETLADNFGNRKWVALKHGKLPHIRIHEVVIEGPIYDSWPSLAQSSILGRSPFDPRRVQTLIRNFATKAFRRPAQEVEIESLMGYYNERRLEVVDNFQAFKDTLKRVLCSPGFLYLHEPTNSQGMLDDYAIASRLSYFLWSSLPDSALIELAGAGQLSNPETLRSQVQRMLEDPKAEAFTRNFVDIVLTLKDLGSQPPDRRAFQVFYERNLQRYMYEETYRFVSTMLDENRPILDLIAGDFTFINEPLAELYGYDGVSGLDFRKVPVNDPRRSGVLGHASILTVTANGIDTSPVIRGVWMLENILGAPPSPPPPDVEPFDPDTRGATSLRDQLEKHRENPTCYECHRKIDPLGFAFEGFDPIGRWRARYDDTHPIDSSGTLPNGASFESIGDFKEILLERREQIVRALSSKLLSLASGRRMEAGDRREIDQIVADVEGRGDGFRDLVEAIALSEIVLSR